MNRDLYLNEQRPLPVRYLTPLRNLHKFLEPYETEPEVSGSWFRTVTSEVLGRVEVQFTSGPSAGLVHVGRVYRQNSY